MITHIHFSKHTIMTFNLFVKLKDSKRDFIKNDYSFTTKASLSFSLSLSLSLYIYIYIYIYISKFILLNYNSLFTYNTYTI